MAALAAAAALGADAARYRAAPPPDPTVAQRPIAVDVAGDAPAQTCQACHPRFYATWYASYHRTMTQVVGPQTVLGDFDDVELENQGIRYRLGRRGDEFWVAIDSPGADGGTRHEDKRVVMSTGSHHQQIYWVASGAGRALTVLPFAYLIADRRWTPLDAVFMRPPEVRRHAPAGEWNNNCIRCHATRSVPRLDQAAGAVPDTHVLDFGIACTECHGPGAEHVRVNHNPVRRYEARRGRGADSTIVHPGKLWYRRSAQVCGRCHGVTLRDPAELRHWDLDGFRFRPGDELADTQVIVQRGHRYRTLDDVLREQPQFLDTMFWSDGMVRVSGREFNGLLLTPCYQRGEMSCLSCHKMHQSRRDPRPIAEWANDQLARGMDTDLSCVQCHKAYQDTMKVVAHSHHLLRSTGSRCANCHMPYTTWGLMKAIRSHQIDSPTVQASLETGRPNACNLCHLDRTLGWTADSLARWYKTPKPMLVAEMDSVSAAVLWLLRGDAGQRALVAWSMGWEPARAASGSDWLVPYLAHLLDDPYDVVRYAAARSLRQSPEFRDLDYDPMAAGPERAALRARLLAAWSGAPTPDAARGAALLLDARGQLRWEAFDRLLRGRDDRYVLLAE